jgi:hypothetical protein
MQILCKSNVIFFASLTQATSTPTAPAKSECGSILLQQLLTSEETSTLKLTSELSKPANEETKPGQMTPGSFQFTFKKEEKKPLGPTSPRSPEVDEQGFYLNKVRDVFIKFEMKMK